MEYKLGNFSKDYKREIKSDLTIGQINRVLKDLNDYFLDYILLENGELSLYGLCSFHLERLQRNFDKLAVDWYRSNKNKKEILARGGKIATKIGISDKGNPIFDDGEKWMVFFLDDFYFRVVKKNLCIKKEDGTIKPLVFNVFFWKYIQNDKLLKRFNHYKNNNKLNILDIPLNNGHKNDFV